MKPILKWPGGKRWLAPVLARVLDQVDHERIVEPFAGAAALYFAREPAHALLGDTNHDLMMTYLAIREDPAAVVAALDGISIDVETYAAMSAMTPTDMVARAARLIYLNRAAFAGIWRVNKQGAFNVPFGCKPTTKLPDASVIQQASSVLQNALLRHEDFFETLSEVREADVVYCDPPYTVSHNNNGFLRYNERIFSWADQCKLAKWCNEAARSGMAVIVSNALHHDIIELYSHSDFRAFGICRPSNLAADPEKRKVRQELLLFSRSLVDSVKHLAEVISRPGYPAEDVWR